MNQHIFLSSFQPVFFSSIQRIHFSDSCMLFFPYHIYFLLPYSFLYSSIIIFLVFFYGNVFISNGSTIFSSLFFLHNFLLLLKFLRENRNETHVCHLQILLLLFASKQMQEMRFFPHHINIYSIFFIWNLRWFKGGGSSFSFFCCCKMILLVCMSSFRRILFIISKNGPKVETREENNGHILLQLAWEQWTQNFCMLYIDLVLKWPYACWV